MDYSKFYTPLQIAYLLIQQLKIPAPSEIVDICCGSCNLLRAAGKRWSKAKLTGVDIAPHVVPNITCIKCDGREFALEHAGMFSLVLANPPFDFVDAKCKFPKLYEDIPAKCETSRLEVEMLFANLRMLKAGGTLVIIVPNTLIVGERYKQIRKYLSKNYHIQRVIHLPNDTFGSTNISSCALIIKREKLSQHYTYRSYVTHENNKYSISKKTIIPQEHIRSGDWNIYIPVPTKQISSFRRGNISSQYFTETGIAILHTAKLESPWKPSVRYVTTPPRKEAVYAEDGDIIIGRIGKSAGQWCKYTGPRILVSDCLYVLKDKDGLIFKKINGRHYPYPIKGVATRYITISDFNSWISSLSFVSVQQSFVISSVSPTGQPQLQAEAGVFFSSFFFPKLNNAIVITS